MMEPTKFDAQSYKNILKYYYANVNSCVFTQHGEHLLVLLDSGEIGLFEIGKIMRENYELADTQDYNDDDIENKSDISTEFRRSRPLAYFPLECNDFMVAFDEIRNDSPQQLTTTTKLNSSSFFASGQGCVELCSLSASADSIETRSRLSLKNEYSRVKTMRSAVQRLYVATDECKVTIFDKETLSQTQEIKQTGCVTSMNCFEDRNILFTSSTDGCVRSWDVRDACAAPITEICPAQESNSCNRPKYGKCLETLDVSPNLEYVVCGGGPNVSLWHWTSRRMVSVARSNCYINSAIFSSTNSSTVTFSGQQAKPNQLYIWNVHSGKPKRIATSIGDVRHITPFAYTEANYDFFLLSGASFRLDIYKSNAFLDIPLYLN